MISSGQATEDNHDVDDNLLKINVIKENCSDLLLAGFARHMFLWKSNMAWRWKNWSTQWRVTSSMVSRNKVTVTGALRLTRPAIYPVT